MVRAMTTIFGTFLLLALTSGLPAQVPGPGDGNPDPVQDRDQDRVSQCDGFVDEDGDGICDLCGCDHDPDRIRDQDRLQDCDGFVDEDGDGICDLCGCDHTQNANENRRRFRRGDVDGDGAQKVNDAIYMLNAMFRGGELGCPDAADVNDDGQADISDCVRLLLALFCGKADTVPPPFQNPGEDPTPDGLGCE